MDFKADVAKFTLALEKDFLLGTMPCSGGQLPVQKNKGKTTLGIVQVNNRDGGVVQHEIRFLVEIGRCGKILNARIDIINTMGGTGKGEDKKPQPFRDTALEERYPLKKKAME